MKEWTKERCSEEPQELQLVADGIYTYFNEVEQLHCDIAIMNGGGIRATVKAGDITKKDINTVLPFGNTLAVVYVTGAELLEALEASTFCTPESLGGFPQAAGVTFAVKTY